MLHFVLTFVTETVIYMNRRLQQFLTAENISQSQFADTIGVARASVSHIIAGRNKPGFDFIENMSKRYPTLNLEWLIMGKGKMYKSQGETPSNTKTYEESADLFSEVSYADSEVQETPKTAAIPQPKPATETVQSRPSNDIITSVSKTQVINNQRTISKILVFYSDGTYQELA